jgi:type I restriction enzyme, S subunit
MKLPKGWEIVSLAKVAKIQTGLAKGKKDQKNVVSLPYLRVANVQDGYLDLSEIKEIEVDFSQVNRYLLQNEDILLTEGGDFDKLGRGGIWHCQINPCLHQNHVFAVRVNRENLIPYFFAQQVSSFYGKAYFLSCAKQTTNLASINSTQLKEFPVLLPPLLEQCRIAEVLGVWDESIDLVERLIGRVRSRKQGLMQQLLTGKKRFNEFDLKSSFSIRSSYFESKLGELPDDWNIVNLPDVLYFQEGPGVQNHQFTQSGVKLLNGSNIQKAELILDNTSRYIDEDEAYGKYKHFLVDAGDLVIASSGISVDKFEDKIAFVAEKDLPLCMNTSTIRFKVKDKMQVNLAYFKYFMMTALFKDQIRRQITGSAQLNFGPTHLNLTLLVLPPLPEQEKIAAVLSAADEEISTLEKQLAAYKQQKLGLMQQLLTGRIRI